MTRAFCDSCRHCDDTKYCREIHSGHYNEVREGLQGCDRYHGRTEGTIQPDPERYTLKAADGITTVTPGEDTAILSETARGVREMAAMIRSQGEMLRIMGERMAAMERTIRTLEKVTPGHVQKVNKLVRQRAADVCEEYRIPGEDKAVAAMIRREIRLMTGTQAVREISRCDMEAVEDLIVGWDDYERILRLIKTRRELGK